VRITALFKLPIYSSKLKAMKVLKIFLIVILSLTALTLLVSAWLGAFSKLEFQVKEQGGELVVYEDITGDYSKSAKVMDRVYYSLLNDHAITTSRGFGIYFDNPREVEKSKLRSQAGCIIEEADIEKISFLPVNSMVLPAKNYLVTEFPYKNQASVIVALMKVYPAMNRYVQENNIRMGAVTEIYDIPNKKITYRAEILED
jgi:DNA gyrase inhibitor GyrI